MSDRSSGRRMSRGRGRDTALQRQAARKNPWIQAVKKHSRETGMSYRDAMIDLAKQKRGSRNGSKRMSRSRRTRN